MQSPICQFPAYLTRQNPIGLLLPACRSPFWVIQGGAKTRFSDKGGDLVVPCTAGGVTRHCQETGRERKSISDSELEAIREL